MRVCIASSEATIEVQPLATTGSEPYTKVLNCCTWWMIPPYSFMKYVGPMGAVALVEGDVLTDDTWCGSASFLIITVKFLVSVIINKEIIHLKATILLKYTKGLKSL